jgi:heavy metal-binding protein
MDQRASKEQNYYCPMHSDVRQPNLGKCPRCGMDLVPEGTRFALLRHMVSNPLHLIVMIALMAAIMAAAMMMMR